MIRLEETTNHPFSGTGSDLLRMTGLTITSRVDYPPGASIEVVTPLKAGPRDLTGS
jgi:hypothetical protein